MQQYEVVSWVGLIGFNRVINNKLQSGWRCQGGVIVLTPNESSNHHREFAQAMILDDDDDTKVIADAYREINHAP